MESVGVATRPDTVERQPCGNVISRNGLLTASAWMSVRVVACALDTKNVTPDGGGAVFWSNRTASSLRGWLAEKDTMSAHAAASTLAATMAPRDIARRCTRRALSSDCC